ncbi:MAG: hypothetical protein D6762_07500 [Candidatus Neomarinimicrobiota bacterium]|nr:MAG: hypothetical protein D6762_07500 [Candidatus Neomarinimicrobiota bacterium]
MKSAGVCAVLLGVLWAQAADMTPDSIRAQVEREAARIQDYTVTLTVTVHMPKFRMPRKKITVYFKAGDPYRLKLKTRGFALLPKSGVAFRPQELFDNFSHFDRVTRQTTADGWAYVLEGTLIADSLHFKLPESEQERPVLHQQLWVDPDHWVITRSTVWVDTSRVLTMTTAYDEVSGGWTMPVRTEVRFQVGTDLIRRFNRTQTGPAPILSEDGAEIPEEGLWGEVLIEYSRYRINQGLRDEIFEEESP